MIFVTVGTQLPFDRMVDAVDAWAAAHPEVEMFAQVGPTKHPPRHQPHAAFLSPTQADEHMRNAELIVAHAGMGSVLTALALRKPILIVPRRAALGEHRNDHQLATARWLARRPGVIVAMTEQEIAPLLDRRGDLVSGQAISTFASGPLVERVAAEIERVSLRRR